jgi:hypothetical protein
MKRLSMLAVFASFALAPSFAFADPPPVGPGGPGTALAYAAHDLTSASELLTQILGARAPADHVVEDAMTLYDAAEHFEEEVILGPEDLDVDFAAIEATFNEMREEFRRAPCIQQDAAARSAWFQVSEANLRLRVTWFSHCPGAPPGRVAARW